MRHITRRLRAATILTALLTALHFFLPAPASAVPGADHVLLDLAALKLCVNDLSVRYQLKLTCYVNSSVDGGLDGVKGAEMTITSPSGGGVTLKPRSAEIMPKRFKAASATLLFKAIDDSASRALSNVPSGFFALPGEYSAYLTLRGEKYRARFSFGPSISLRAEQTGLPVENYSLLEGLPLTIVTEPQEFGPVYYKRQDYTNFMFMLNNMDQALESKDYHPEVESPKYVFQVRIADSQGGPARLLDPAKYIAGHQEFLIRSDMTATPLTFGAGEFKPGEVVVVDFMRQDTLKPNEGLSGPAEGFSGQIVSQSRVVYALAVAGGTVPEELKELAVAEDTTTASDYSGR